MRETKTIETFIEVLGNLGDFEGMIKAKWLKLAEIQGDLTLNDKVTFYNRRCLGKFEEPFAVYSGIQKGFQDIPDFKLYTIFWDGHILDRSTRSRESIDKVGITDIREGIK